MSKKSEMVKRLETLKEPGYYWWLPICFDLQFSKKEEWQVICWHPQNPTCPTQGYVIGPIECPWFQE